jgi:hypothetical protein
VSGQGATHKRGAAPPEKVLLAAWKFIAGVAKLVESRRASPESAPSSAGGGAVAASPCLPPSVLICESASTSVYSHLLIRIHNSDATMSTRDKNMPRYIRTSADSHACVVSGCEK